MITYDRVSDVVKALHDVKKKHAGYVEHLYMDVDSFVGADYTMDYFQYTIYATFKDNPMAMHKVIDSTDYIFELRFDIDEFKKLLDKAIKRVYREG